MGHINSVLSGSLHPKSILHESGRHVLRVFPEAMDRSEFVTDSSSIVENARYAHRDETFSSLRWRPSCMSVQAYATGARFVIFTCMSFQKPTPPLTMNLPSLSGSGKLGSNVRKNC